MAVVGSGPINKTQKKKQTSHKPPNHTPPLLPPPCCPGLGDPGVHHGHSYPQNIPSFLKTSNLQKLENMLCFSDFSQKHCHSKPCCIALCNSGGKDLFQTSYLYRACILYHPMIYFHVIVLIVRSHHLFTQISYQIFPLHPIIHIYLYNILYYPFISVPYQISHQIYPMINSHQYPMMWPHFRGLDQVRSFAEAKKARDMGGTIEKP